MFAPTRLVSRFIGFGSLNVQTCSRCFSILYMDLIDPRQLHKSNIQMRTNVFKAAHMFNVGESPLLDKTVGQLLADAAELWPERPSVISLHQNLRVTFSELLRRVDIFAAGLKKLGVQKGDRLGIWGPNDFEWLLSSLSASRIGAITVAINPAYQQNELNYCLQKVDIKAVVAPATFKTQNYPKMLLAAKEVCPNLEHIIIYSQDHVTGTCRLVDVEALATKTEVDAIAAEQSEISCHDGCNIQFTSGSTGTPKATFLSHRSLVNNCNQGMLRGKLNSYYKICLNVPFFHAFGMLFGQIFSINKGNTLVLEARSFNPIKSLEAITKEKCNITYGTPTMWANLVDAQKQLQLPIDSLHRGVIGGAPASPELFKRIQEILGLHMMCIYGLTETTGIVFQTASNPEPEILEKTVGYLGPHIEAMVVNEAGLPVPFGTPGELWIRGYCNMLCYWDDKVNTEKSMTSDGWFKTGDQFILQENGYGMIVGRLKDMLIRGGENIFPKEIEDFLMTHPKILEAQVIGAYDSVYGEEVCACIKLRDSATVLTEDEVKNYCRGEIAYFKIPRYIIFVDEYPKTASGKIQKNHLKEQLQSKGAIPKKPSNL